jgi:hypothetical protein
MYENAPRPKKSLDFDAVSAQHRRAGSYELLRMPFAGAIASRRQAASANHDAATPVAASPEEVEQ